MEKGRAFGLALFIGMPSMCDIPPESEAECSIEQSGNLGEGNCQRSCLGAAQSAHLRQAVVNVVDGAPHAFGEKLAGERQLHPRVVRSKSASPTNYWTSRFHVP